MSAPKHHPLESEEARMIRLIRELRIGGRPQLQTQIVLLIELTTGWTQDMIEQCLIHQPRAFYYNLKYSTIADARLTIERVKAAQASVCQRLGLAPDAATVPLLFGINRREYHLGLFGCGRRELHLRAGARFILTADRRMGRRGCRRAVYCNMHQALENVVTGSAIVIGSDATTPPDTAELQPVETAAANVVLTVCYVHDLSIVCSVQQSGTIYPCSPVQLPAVAYDSTISRESRDNIDFALECAALAIVVPVPKNDVYHQSMVAYVRERQQHLGDAYRRLYVMTHMDRCGDRQQRQFICNVYDGVIYRQSVQRLRCAQHLAIELTQAELAMRNLMRAAQKPLFLMDQTAYDVSQGDVVEIPRLADSLADLVHYYADGILLMAPAIVVDEVAAATAIDEAEAGINAALYRYTYMLHCMRPKELACSLRHMDTTLDVDRTRTGQVQMARIVVLAVFAQRAAAILVATSSGRTAQNLAAWRPCCPVIAVVDGGRVGRMLALCRGVHRVSWTPPSGDAKVEADEAARVSSSKDVQARWQRSQYHKHLCGIFAAVQYGMITSTDRVVIVCRSSRTATACDTFHMCTVAEFVRRFEMLYGCDEIKRQVS